MPRIATSLLLMVSLCGLSLSCGSGGSSSLPPFPGDSPRISGDQPSGAGLDPFVPGGDLPGSPSEDPGDNLGFGGFGGQGEGGGPGEGGGGHGGQGGSGGSGQGGSVQHDSGAGGSGGGDAGSICSQCLAACADAGMSDCAKLCGDYCQ
ncbi:MAG: hypothetical protein HY898_36150 [Deltaproteobacteria bacterium]|nr:hypothetical protein [Deltaproteobacteria bacterium]